MAGDSQLDKEVFERLLARERRSRKEAERLLDQKSVELYDVNLRLRGLADELEQRVERRTAELEAERNRAVESAEALRESERRFSAVASIVGEYLWELDANYCFTAVTGQVASVLGYTEKDLIGRPIVDYMPVEDAAKMLRVMQRAAEGGEVFTNFAHRAHAKEGHVVWQRSSGAPSFDSEKRLIGFRGASLDVSEEERSKEQMQQLVIALQHASEAIVMTDKRGSVIFANAACARIFGYPASGDLVGVPWQQFYNNAEAKRFEAGIATKLRAGAGYSSEGMGRRVDGTEFPGHFSFNRLPNGELLWICRDESERISTLMSLQTQNSLLSALLENIRIGVLFEDASGEEDILYNLTVVQMLGIERSEFEGLRRANPLFDQLRARCADEASESVLEKLISLQGECYNLQLHLDEAVYLIVDRIPVYVGTTYRGALWAIRDVSEDRHHEREMEESRLLAEAGDRAKSTFLANMSHEIRTPLNGICGMARILLSASLDDSAFEQVRAIQTSADSLLHVLNDILDFSKVEAGQLDIEIVDFDFAQVLDLAFTVLQSRALEKQLRFDFVYPDARLPLLKGDPSRLNEVLLNLLGNSIKFTDHGGITLSSRIVSESEGSVQLEFSVCDTGIGMNAEELAHVFEPFMQADSSISRRFGGSGLGLSISRNLIQLMDGTMSVESSDGKGSEFTVLLPFEVADGFTDRAEEADLSKLSAFVVTRSDAFYQVVKSMLAYVNVRPIRVRNTEEAVSCFAETDSMKGVLLLDRVQQPDYIPDQDADLVCSLPLAVSRILISDVAPKDPVAGLDILPYPFSRYKLLSVIFDLLNQRLPRELFQKFDPKSFDSIDLTGLRILLAEDNTINQKVARMTIERFGASVDVAANGLEVLELVERFEYDLILMDIRMPEMDGVEACRRIRARGLKLPIHALTADAMKGDRERFLEAGMDGYLSKPLMEVDLVNLLLNNQKNSEARAPAAQGEPEAVHDNVKLSTASELFAEAADADVLDVEMFYNLLSGQEALAHELLEQFVIHGVECMEEGVQALKEGDLNTARGRFHKLAGSAATICAKQVRAYFLSYERYLIEDPPNVAACESNIQLGLDAMSRLSDTIEKLINESAK